MTFKPLKLILFILLVCSFSLKLLGQNNPKADDEAVIISGNMRFTILTPEMIRIEWNDAKQFEDRASFIMVNRKMPVPKYSTKVKDGYLYISTEKLDLKYKEGTYPLTNPASPENLSISFKVNGSLTHWYPGKKDPLNLKGTTRTLDNAKGDSMRGAMENGILSRSGWVVIDEAQTNGDTSKSLLFENQGGAFDWVAERSLGNNIDWYFMGYGHEYKKALADYTKVAGKIPMPPLYSFGYWYSKYERYTEDDFKEIVNEIHKRDIPMDVMVVDMDWHYAGHEKDGGRGGWTGWTWNKSLFPDPQEFLNWLHDKNLNVTLNLHPADGVAPHEDHFEELADDLNLPKDQTIKWNIENENFYQKFFKNILYPQEEMGVDFWWLDWQQWPLTPGVKDLGNTFWLNHVFYNDMKTNRPDRRPMIFHRWGGMGNHRYQIGFSGDAWATFPSLAFQVYYNSTASNVAYGYWSHDLGGHIQPGDNNPELYLRWIQFGIFSPITRTHATNAAHIERRIWKYPNYELMKDAIKFRYTMIPYIYTYSRKAYDTGISLCRPLYYDSPEENEAYKQETTYMFGDEILVSPIVTASEFTNGTALKNIWLPEGKWLEAETGTVLEGNHKYLRSFAQSEIPFFYKEGAIIPKYPDVKHLKERPDTLIIDFIPGSAGSFSYYEDNGDNDEYKEGKYTTTPITQITNSKQGVYTIHPRKGSFEHMPDARHYKLELLSKLPAKQVIVNGKKYSYATQPQVGYWSYDSKQLAIVINTPSISCDTKIEIKVDFDENQAASEQLLSGKMGQMKRLQQCNDSLTQKLNNKIPALFTKLVETSKRIATNPENTLQALRFFENNLEASFNQLLEIENAPVREINEWKNFILESKNTKKQSDFGGSEKNEAMGYNVDGTKLWITGPAVPGETAILTEDPAQVAGFFRYHGKLQTGEFKIINTPTIQADTKYYVPVMLDENAIGNSGMKLTENADLPGWKVTIADDYYKLKINAKAETLNGEIFVAREDLYIVGGATQVGWNSDKAIRLRKDLNNPNLFIFSGVLKNSDSGEERNSFKLLGQNDWGPVSFHPAVQHESILGSKYIYENLPGDHKWTIHPSKQGHYVIKVDLFQETIEAYYSLQDPNEKDNDIQYSISTKKGKVLICADESIVFDSACLKDSESNQLALKKNPKTKFSIGKKLQPGEYYLELSINDKLQTEKVIIE
ncbi:TIM-barrel domain-containing protein [Plebeiibacterium sediminum]|uniref:Glycoside hydrolase family 31 protein n=1 Tax=Plebeiibacterium sediminum TaxID=2992112 RepID=A0AAE3M2Y8_9BACT|nr:TIM-barrel domain-containing protein [Plebeiobacterium sediminum]MCW3786281.1 glycoside hydrolase family 31 protein [Plebeiobacterium sediminum]